MERKEKVVLELKSYCYSIEQEKICEELQRSFGLLSGAKNVAKKAYNSKLIQKANGTKVGKYVLDSMISVYRWIKPYIVQAIKKITQIWYQAIEKIKNFNNPNFESYLKSHEGAVKNSKEEVLEQAAKESKSVVEKAKEKISSVLKSKASKKPSASAPSQPAAATEKKGVDWTTTVQDVKMKPKTEAPKYEITNSEVKKIVDSVNPVLDKTLKEIKVTGEKTKEQLNGIQQQLKETSKNADSIAKDAVAEAFRKAGFNI